MLFFCLFQMSSAIHNHLCIANVKHSLTYILGTIRVQKKFVNEKIVRQNGHFCLQNAYNTQKLISNYLVEFSCCKCQKFWDLSLSNSVKYNYEDRWKI